MKNKSKYIILLVFVYLSSLKSFAQIDTEKDKKSGFVEFTPMKYKYTCNLVQGNSPWKTLVIAPQVHPDTNELDKMVAPIIGRWRDPEKYKEFKSHSIYAKFYTTNDPMAYLTEVNEYKDVDLERSFVGDFYSLKCASAVGVFIAQSRELIINYKVHGKDYNAIRAREYNNNPNNLVKIEEPVDVCKKANVQPKPTEIFYYQCESEHPVFNPQQWVDDQRYGEFAQELMSQY
ncbi:MAG: hypothetical protein KDD58_14155 [Bdellovibrionales bacterium]|nr:hypothetical protein [Bdellovibrionales bacterium]